jgi:hypothetical protein
MRSGSRRTLPRWRELGEPQPSQAVTSQPVASANGLADVHLLHIASTSALTPDKDLMLVSDTKDDRARHLAGYGTGQMLAAWEESTTTGDFPQSDKNRQMYIQVLDSAPGAARAGSSATSMGPLMLSPNVLGSRYQDFRSYPDGSVAYPQRSRPSVAPMVA